MRKLLAVITSVFCCILFFEAQSQGAFARVLKAPRIPKLNVEVSKIARPHTMKVGGLVKRLPIAGVSSIIPRVKQPLLAPKPTYLFLYGLSQIQLDSITNLNNRSYRFLSHGVETIKAYRHAADSIDSLTSRYDSLFHGIDSISADDFAKIQSTDSVLARYIKDQAMGYPEQMLMWSELLCEVYPHVTRKVMKHKPIDFDEVAEKRREYFLSKSFIFKDIYCDILTRMVTINGTHDFD